MVSNEMSITFPALSRNEAFARSVAAAFMVQLDPTIEELTDVRTAISEAVTNAIIHGYSQKRRHGAHGLQHRRRRIHRDNYR